MKRPKKERMQETRDFDTRDNHLRAIMDMDFANPMHIPRELIPEGIEYYWARVSFAGQDDHGRLIELRRRGWTVVPADRHPELVFTDPLQRNTHMNGYIHHKGAILVERRKELCDAERRMINERNYKDQHSMPGTENYMGDPTMPVRNDSQTYFGGFGG